MGENDATCPPCVRLTRRLPASPEKVFDAWTDGESMGEWLHPSTVNRVNADLDVKVGGDFHIVMSDETAKHDHHGTYLAVERPSRLAFTWSSPGTREQETRLTVELAPDGDGTELVLTHEQLPDLESAHKHTAGWLAILDRLSARLSNGTDH